MALTSKSTKVAKFFNQRFNLPTVLPLTEEAVERAAELTKQAQAVAKVTTPEEYEVAVDAGRDIQTHAKGVEAFGLDFRRPIKAFTDLVKKTQDDYLEPLYAEQTRLKKLAGDFQQAEAERVARDEQERQKQLERAEETQRAREEAAAEAARKAAESGNKRDIAKAEKLEATAAVGSASFDAIVRAPEPQATKVTGSIARKKLRYEVLDIKAVYAAAPHLCNLEIKASAVQSCCVPEMPVNGLKMWWENDVSFLKR